MKKEFCLVIAIVLIAAALVGCSNDSAMTQPPPTVTEPAPTAEPTSTPTVVPTPTPTATPTPTRAPTPTPTTPPDTTSKIDRDVEIEGDIDLPPGCLPGGMLGDAATVSSCNAQAMQQVESFSFDGEFNLLAIFPVEGVGEEGSIRISGAIVLPDRFRFKISLNPDGAMIEMNGVVIGEDSYIRDPESNQWFKGSPPDSDFLGVVQMVGLLHLPNDASATLNESIDLDDGTRGYLLVSDQTGQESGMEGLGLLGGNLIRVVGADDFLTREIRIVVEGVDDEARDLITIRYHGYNEPLEIEPPAKYLTLPDDSMGSGYLGAVEVARGEAIQIRSMHVLTGLGDLGAPSQRGVAMALADYGPIKGHGVSMGAGLDSLCTEEGGRAAADAVIGDPRVVGVIGTSCSVAATAASPILSEAGLVMISSSNTAPSLTSDLRGNAGSNYHPGYYRTASNDLYEARAVAQFAYNELGLRRMAAIDDGDPYTTGLTSAFTTAFEELGGSVAVTSVSRGDTDMVPVLTQLASDGPDGLFFPLFQGEGAHIVRQVGQIAGLEDVTLIGGAALLVSEFLAIPESEGVYLPGPELSFGNNTNEATGKSGEALVADYRERYGEASTSAYLAHAYDAATMLLRAIDEVAVGDGDTLYIDRAKLREALAGVAGFRGIIGVISCDEFGDCGTGRVQITHHTDSSVTDIAELPVVYSYAP